MIKTWKKKIWKCLYLDFAEFRLKISFNICFLSRCENEERNSCYPLHTSPILSMFGCFIYLTIDLRIHWRLSTIFKTRNESAWSNDFWHVKVCILWKCIQYKHEIKQKFKKITGRIYALFFLSWAPNHQFYSWFSILIWAEAQGSSL